MHAKRRGSSKQTKHRFDSDDSLCSVFIFSTDPVEDDVDVADVFVVSIATVAIGGLSKHTLSVRIEEQVMSISPTSAL